MEVNGVEWSLEWASIRSSIPTGKGLQGCNLAADFAKSLCQPQQSFRGAGTFLPSSALTSKGLLQRPAEADGTLLGSGFRHLKVCHQLPNTLWAEFGIFWELWSCVAEKLERRQLARSSQGKWSITAGWGWKQLWRAGGISVVRGFILFHHEAPPWPSLLWDTSCAANPS